MRLTDALLGEHGMLYALFDHIEEITRERTTSPAIDSTCAILERLLISHAALEEDLLFKDLEPHLGHGGPLSVMRAEHEEIDRLIAESRNAGDQRDGAQSLARALQVARSHFQKEEMVLFPIALSVLDDVALVNRGADWARARRVTLD